MHPRGYGWDNVGGAVLIVKRRETKIAEHMNDANFLIRRKIHFRQFIVLINVNGRRLIKA